MSKITIKKNKSFPATFVFSKSKWAKTFHSTKDFLDWASTEIAAWQQYVHLNHGHMVRENYRHIENLNFVAESPIGNVIDSIEVIKDHYIPNESLKEFLAPLNTDPQSIVYVICELVSPGTLNFGQGQTSGPKALAAIYSAYGNPRGLVAAIQEGQNDIEEMRNQFQRREAEIEKFFIDKRASFDEFFQTFSEKVALSEPRKFWTSRAENHTSQANAARRIWHGALLLSLGVGILLLLLSSFNVINLAPGTEDIKISAIVMLERLTIVGTALGLVVWWLRQKLRDIRVHEHLAEDAAERVTMIDTYTAMREGALQDADMAPVLAALYRPATTGLMGDEGPVLPMEILLKSVGARAGKN